MRGELIIAVAQPDCIPYDVGGNALIHAEVIRGAAARVVVFPELSITGYYMDAPAIDTDDPRLEPIVAACAESGSIALVGVPLRGHGGRSHIAVLAVDAAGIDVAYSKINVDSSEANRFTPGEQPSAIDVDGWRLGLAICKDTGIEQHWADTAALSIDAYVGGTVMFDHERAKQDGRAVAIAARHGLWVALASFAGSTGEGYEACAGGSGVWGRDGAVRSQVGPYVGAIARAVLTDS